MRFPRLPAFMGRPWVRALVLGIVVIAMVASALLRLLDTSGRAAAVTQQPHGRLGDRIVMTGTLPPALAKAKRGTRVAGTDGVQLSIGLRLSNERQFHALLANQQNPKSPQFHKYLTPQSFDATYAPAAANLSAVLGFLKHAGLNVTSVTSNRILIDAKGTVAQAERAFDIQMYHYHLGNLDFYAPDREPSVPENLAPMIQNIGGLDTLFQMTPHYKINGHAKASSAQGAFGPKAATPVAGAFGPTQLQSAYDVTPIIPTGNPAGIVGIFELAPYIPGDIDTYYADYYPGTTRQPILNTSVDFAPVTGDAPGTAEADLDIQVVYDVSPRAQIEVFTGPNTTQGVNDTYASMSNGPEIITTSWGLCETFTGQSEMAFLDNLYAQWRSLNKTIFASAGDSGSDDCGSGGDLITPAPPTVDFPSSSPNVMSVGGTSLTLNGTGGYGAETVWNDRCGAGPCGGGGGVSTFFAQPAHQVGAGVNNDFNGGVRTVPDVAADADPVTGYSIFCTSAFDCGPSPIGGWLEFGGTSASAPLWAGMLYDIERFVCSTAPAKCPVGWVNATLYQAFANLQASAPYHDITTGTNNIDYTKPPFAGDYPATTCYDLTTGIGSPDATNLAHIIANGVATAGGGSCPVPAVTRTELLTDNGFDNNVSGWQTFSKGDLAVISPINPRSTPSAFFACGYPGCDDRVAQTFTVPATVNSATLRLWVDGTTELSILSNTPPCVDHFYVTLATRDGTVIDTVQATCNFFTFFGYAQEVFPVTAALKAHAGQQVTLMIRATTANLVPFPDSFTAWFVDDVSLVVS